VRLKINKETIETEVKYSETLLETLFRLGIICHSWHWCGVGECGRCAVVIDGRETCSCLVLTLEVEGKDILLIDIERRSEQ